MNEQEWLTSNDPAAMLGWLTGVPPHDRADISDRTLLLWVRAVLDTSEKWKEEHRNSRYVDNALRELEAWAEHNITPRREHWHFYGNLMSPVQVATRICGWRSKGRNGDVPLSRQATLLRDIAGNPWRPTTLCGVTEGITRTEPVPGCEACALILRWNDGTVPRLAQRIYDERDFACLPMLADALTDAGCDSEELLRHLRGEERCHACATVAATASNEADWKRSRCALWCPGWMPLRGPHVQGCWALDLLLGKE